ncbi:MAG: glycoside hydrolase family 3 C-terminal domain-containing protein [Acidobacteriia bacterium]|nr:glycoside hydrolase family 3 C-terminal domain-containing protein [Terriglobia bacterium]
MRSSPGACRSAAVVVFSLLLAATASAQPAARAPVYLDPSQPIERRVADLLGRMTLEEKLGQINMPCVYVDPLGMDNATKIESCRRFTEGRREKGIGPGGGFFTFTNTVVPEGTRHEAELLNELQKIAIEKTRLKIPLLQTEEGTHGLMCSGATVFPEGLTIGSTWNMDLVKRIYTVAAREARAIGIHQIFTLVIEPNRDPRLGRNQEGFSEDPYMCSRIAETIVGAAQGDDVSAADKVVAGLCHYPGQSQPASGFERGAMEISERMLREVFLPPWVAGIKKAGGLGVMATYPAIDGVPTHSSDWILTRILREEMGFQGLVLGEGSGISTLIYEHIAPDQKKAGEWAIKAGLDVGISYEPGYMQPMAENVREGRVSMSYIDRAVTRILRQKFRLGLFDHPYVDPEHAVEVTHTKESQDLALEVAREGIVLLKNENHLLPLKKDIKSIAVIGPNADREGSLLGDYVAHKVLQHVITILEGVREKAGPGTHVEYVKGCDVMGTKVNEIEKAVQAAKRADVAIVVVGENPREDKEATDGEGYDVASLDLTGLQEELVEAVSATGTPAIVVLNNGRPLSVRWIAEHVPAVVEAWLPGEQGGRAVADVLFGDYNPSGRLPITVARHVGQLPVYYNYKPSKEYWIKDGWGRRYVDMSPLPLWEFGDGLSYTTFEYGNLRIEDPRIHTAGEVHISAEVRNAGDRAGAEVVQLYLRDVISSVTTPVKQLKRFEKVTLAPGEKKMVRFTLGPDDLSLLERQLKRVVEPGEFKVMIGHSSQDIRLTGSFEVVE